MPVLTLYRRHKKSCEHRKCHRNLCKVAQRLADGKPTKCACRCPLWADGFYKGQEIRKSLRETTWEAAGDALERLKNNCGRLPGKTENELTTIGYAAERYLTDARSQNLHESTIYKYRSLFGQLKAFAVKKGMRYVKQFELETLAEFRERWKDGPRSSAKKLERLRSFLRFAQEREWIAKNPTNTEMRFRVAEEKTRCDYGGLFYCCAIAE